MNTNKNVELSLENLYKLENYLIYTDEEATVEAKKAVKNHLFKFPELVASFLGMDSIVCRVAAQNGFKANESFENLLNDDKGVDDFATYVINTYGRGVILSANDVELCFGDHFAYLKD